MVPLLLPNAGRSGSRMVAEWLKSPPAATAPHRRRMEQSEPRATDLSAVDEYD
jgi:hypothetical protein